MRHKAIALSALYMVTIPLANWFISNVGVAVYPDAPHTLPVGFGYRAPSGFVLIAFALLARDMLQELTSRKTIIGLMVAGVVLSYLVNPAVAVASAAAFAASEMADFAIYTALRARRRHFAMLLSGVVGSAIDSFLFLWLAFGSIIYWQGQVIGKVAVTAICVAIVKAQRDLSQRLSAV